MVLALLVLASTPPVFKHNEIWSITGTFKADSSGQIGGGWTGLNAFHNIQLFGNVNANVYVVNGSTTNNMFGGTGQTAPAGGTNYNFFNGAPSSASLTPATGLTNATSYTITITIAFTINAGTKYTVPVSPHSLALTLD